MTCRAVVRACVEVPLLALSLAAVVAPPPDTNAVTYSEHQERLERPLALDQAIEEALRNHLSIQLAAADIKELQGERRNTARWYRKIPNWKLKPPSENPR